MRRAHHAVGISSLFLLTGPLALADVLDKTATVNGTTVHYKVVVPKNFDAAKTYPAILAFPPGGQSMDLVDGMIRANWRAEAEARGYIVVEPAAPDGVLFFEGGDKIFPAFFTKLLGDYKVLNNKFHAAGISNGGLSAFQVAANYPQYFWSVTGFPGYLDSGTPQQMAALKPLCIHMFAGDRDSGWPEEERDQAAKMRASGYNVTFSLEKGEGHVMRTLAGPGAARLFTQFEQARQGTCAK